MEGWRGMPTRLDHVIVLGRDLARLEATFTELGFWVTGGGTHPHLGTQNRLILLDEGYIELLAVADPTLVSPTLTARLARGARGAGWVGFAVQSATIDAEVAAMRGRGLDVRGPTVGRLVAANGAARGWRVATVGADDLWATAEPVPFLIQHDTTGAQHRAELAGVGGAAPHPNGARRLLGVTLATPDRAALAQRLAHTYYLSPADADTTDATLGAATIMLPLAGGREAIALAQPTHAGIAADRLAAAGEGVCMVSVAVGDLGVARRALDASGVVYHDMDDALLITGEDCGYAPLLLIASA